MLLWLMLASAVVESIMVVLDEIQTTTDDSHSEQQ